MGGGSIKKTASIEGRLSFTQMVTVAILEQKERRGSSLDAIKKLIHQKFAVVPTEATSGLVRRAIKKLQGDGAIISGAPAGRKGSGSFKLAPEEKTRLANDAKIKAKKAATPAMKQVKKAPVKKASVKKVKKAGAVKKMATGKKVKSAALKKLAAGKKVAGKKVAAGKKVKSATPKKAKWIVKTKAASKN